MKRSKDDRALIDALCKRLAVRELGVGEMKGTLASGDLVVDVTMKLTRRMSYSDASTLIDKALAALAAGRMYPDLCDALRTKKNEYGGSSWCHNPVSHAIARKNTYQPEKYGEYHFDFRCRVHAEKSRLAGVIAVELPRTRLVGIKKVFDSKQLARVREQMGAEGVTNFLRAHVRWWLKRDDDNDLARARAARKGTR